MSYKRVVQPKKDLFLESVQRMVADDKDLRPDVIVVSGDITSSGDPQGLKDGFQFLRQLSEIVKLSPKHVVVVPGNHDVDRKLFSLKRTGNRMVSTFKELAKKYNFTSPYSPTPFLRHKNFTIVPIDSCGLCGMPSYGKIEDILKILKERGIDRTRIDKIHAALNSRMVDDAGLVDIQAFEEIMKHLAKLKKTANDIRILVMHHHLSPFPIPEIKYFEAVLNAGYIKTRLTTEHFDIVLHGHKHDGNALYEEDLRKDSGLVYVGAPALFDEKKAKYMKYSFDMGLQVHKMNMKTVETVFSSHHKVEESFYCEAPLKERIGQCYQYSKEVSEYFDEDSVIERLTSKAEMCKEIDILALRGRYLLTSEERWFKKAFNKNKGIKKVRLLLLDSTSRDSAVQHYMEERAMSHGEPLKQFIEEGPNTIRYLSAMAFDTATYSKKCLKDKLEVRNYASLPLWRIIRLDDELHVSAYYTKDGEHIRGKALSGYILKDNGRSSSLYSSFLDYFTRSWNESGDCIDLYDYFYTPKLNPEAALLLLRQQGADDNLISHSVATKERVEQIVRMIKRKDPAARLRATMLCVAALLHDIGRVMSETSAWRTQRCRDIHSIESWKFLVPYDPGVAEIALSHALAGITTEEATELGLPHVHGLFPASIEQKILIIADKLEKDRNTIDLIIDSMKGNSTKNEQYYTPCPRLRDSTAHRLRTIADELSDLGVDFAILKDFVERQ